jgi:U-box domain
MSNSTNFPSLQNVYGPQDRDERIKQYKAPVAKKIKKITVKYPENMDQSEKDSLCCPISLELMFAPAITNCSHIFEMRSINRCMAEHDICPICRKQISSINKLSGNHEVVQNLKKINIRYKDKMYTYSEFLKSVYKSDDNWTIKIMQCIEK